MIDLMQQVLQASPDIVQQIQAGKLKALNQLIGKAVQANRNLDVAEFSKLLRNHFGIAEKEPTVQQVFIWPDEHHWKSFFEQSGTMYKDQDGKLCRSSDVKLTITMDFNPFVDDSIKLREYVVSQLQKTLDIVNSQVIKT